MLRLFKWFSRLFRRKPKDWYTPFEQVREVETSNTSQDVIGTDLADKQAEVKQMSWFSRANSLRDEFFDDGPRIYGEGEVFDEEFGVRVCMSSGEEEEFEDDVSKVPGLMPSPWDDYKRFFKKTVELNQEQLNQLKPTDNDNQASNSSNSTEGQ